MSATPTNLEFALAQWCVLNLPEAPVLWQGQDVGHRVFPLTILSWVAPEWSEAASDQVRPLGNDVYEVSLRRERTLQIYIESEAVVGTLSAVALAKKLRDKVRLQATFDHFSLVPAVIVAAGPIVGHPVVHETGFVGSCSFDLHLRYAEALTETIGGISTVVFPMLPT